MKSHDPVWTPHTVHIVCVYAWRPPRWAPEAAGTWCQQLRQTLGKQRLQSFPQAAVMPFQFPVVLLLVWANQGLVLP